MTKAPPAEQAMHRNHVAKVVGDDLKLDASEFDGCWLIIPDHYCMVCWDTHIHCQKHVDADRVVSKSVELSLGHPCCPCGLAALLQWVCCPRTFLGLRAPDAEDRSKNSFDYIEGKADAMDILFTNPYVKRFHLLPYQRVTMRQFFYSMGLTLESKYYAPGFQSLGQRCDKSRQTDLNGINSTWQYSGKSKATSRPWIPKSRAIEAPTCCFGTPLMPSKAVRCAPTCCVPAAFDRDLQLLAAYYSGSRRNDDRPLTTSEQEDKEMCKAIFAGALEVGNIPLMRRYRAVVGALKPEHALVLAGNGHLEGLKWARDEGVDFPPEICVAAASSGKVDVLKYCKENGAPCGDDVMMYAVRSGSVECVEYCLKTLKLPWGERTIMLASKISPEMLKYCLDNGAPEDTYALESALHTADLEVVKVFSKSSRPFPRPPPWMKPGATHTIELYLYNEMQGTCRQIERICAAKGYSVIYKEPTPSAG
uniref:Uncharacterized protein n=1 Tax=Micromonas pusilla TaxID=38833 RepID=A0A7S0GRV5_MICPS|mmetsp:Transcript_3878/g.16488  ORF Transcript_3878/g.16488 Transcript_3878/m.16488 type:complete len:478 (+) Transcript_3878:55-1488(+)|eukprot:CAMPEP_0203018698 /NCGR_PEP_ID=MMETSP1401-20130829/24484_1 /ASSEMBLY_ACC=CAM_ASM_000894 /TAXON_ID=38833 /ORGANISM="Micromonas pusilla, Strain CCAC1681" /LENGTH=477 /DNA_ID=CAMNT_0049760443 /DNA_START=42 /DNA_END=1475 /DNA_ORIENTATION=+